MKLDGKIALVTGAAKGIGKAISRCFAREGSTVGCVDISGADKAARELQTSGFKAFALNLDITDHEKVIRLVEETVRKYGSIDLLVNNAGIIARGTILELTYETWQKVLDVNLNGTFNCCKAVIPFMIDGGGGCILNITSIAGKMGDITASPVYGASKGAINTLTKSLARQLSGYGIRVNAVAPHAIETDMSSQWSEEKRRSVIESIPLKRMGTAEEVAEAALFLVSDAASFITGEILDVNGGFLMD